MRDRFWRLILFIFILVDILVLSSPTWAFPRLPGKAQIIFVSDRNGNWEIYLLNAKGLRNLTRHPAFDSDPAWSPDGSKIAFASNRDGRKSDIYVMDADGRNVRRLTRDPAEDCLPSWSPDGRRIAFISYRDGKGEIYVVDVDEGNLRNLTNYPAANDIEPAWSPDGGKIAFVSDRANGVADIYVMDADGRNPRRLTKHPEVDRNPAWSPDGRWIAFMSHRWRGPNIYVMNVNDRLIKMLTMGSGMVTRWAMDSF